LKACSAFAILLVIWLTHSIRHPHTKQNQLFLPTVNIRKLRLISNFVKSFEKMNPESLLSCSRSERRKPTAAVYLAKRLMTLINEERAAGIVPIDSTAVLRGGK